MLSKLPPKSSRRADAQVIFLLMQLYSKSSVIHCPSYPKSQCPLPPNHNQNISPSLNHSFHPHQPDFHRQHTKFHRPQTIIAFNQPSFPRPQTTIFNHRRSDFREMIRLCYPTASAERLESSVFKYIPSIFDIL